LRHIGRPDIRQAGILLFFFTSPVLLNINTSNTSIMSPASDTGTLSTPVRANAQTHDASTIKTTPSSRRATVISDNIGVLGVK
jgi:hypothetical protein